MEQPGRAPGFFMGRSDVFAASEKIIRKMIAPVCCCSVASPRAGLARPWLRRLVRLRDRISDRQRP
jgi:hypothetical protein